MLLRHCYMTDSHTTGLKLTTQDLSGHAVPKHDQGIGLQARAG